MVENKGMNQGWVYREQVSHCGQTVVEYYAQRYRHSSWADWLNRIESGQVQLNDRPARPHQTLKAGDLLSYHRPPWQEPDVPLEFDLLYEDDDLLAVSKPSGLPVMPGGGFLEHTLLHQLTLHYPDLTPIPIHRLGRGTSGVVLLARSLLGKSSLSQQMRDRQIRKIYRALIGPSALPETLTIATPIGRVPHPLLGSIFAASDRGKPARSHVRVLARSQTNTLLDVEILTGRPHQIRIHLASVGYPLLGDPLYINGGLPLICDSGDRSPVPGDCGYWLHAHRLAFTHPRTHRTIEIESAPPATLQ